MYVRVNFLLQILFVILFGRAKADCEDKSSDFSVIVNEKTFVDKTLLLKQLFVPPRFKLITAPKKFGKSTNMNMMKRFLEIIVDDKGKPVPITETKNYQLFKENNLLISQEEFFKEFFGKFPVLYVDCQSLITVTSFDDLVMKYRNIMHKTFQEHKYLLRNPLLWLDISSKNVFERYVDPQQYQNLTEKEITGGFLYLSRLLSAHFGKLVIVLIDEYDAFVNSMIFVEKPDDKIASFVREVNTALIKPNSFVGRVILTGVLRATGMGLLLPGTNITDYYFLDDHPFSTYYGMTEDELHIVLNRLTSNTDEIAKLKTTIHEFYSGYTIRNKEIQIYNIMSVTKYLKTRQLKSYWYLPRYLNAFHKVFTSSPEILRVIKELIFGNTVEIDITTPLTENEALMLNHIVLSGVVQSSARMKIFMTFLYHSGFLTLAKSEFDNVLSIPSEEIKHELAKVISDIYTEMHHFNPEHIKNFQNVFDLFQPLQDNENHFVSLYKTVDNFFNVSNFNPHDEAEFQSILYLYLLSKPEYSPTKVRRDSVTLEKRTGHVYMCLTNVHNIDIFIKVRAHLAIGVAERKRNADHSIRDIIDKVFMYPHYKIIIGVCLDLDRRASLSYSYYFKPGDNLKNVNVIS